MLDNALCVGVLCGVVGVLVDLDHVIAFYIGRDNHNARVLHKPLFIIAGIIFFGVIAYIGRLVY